MRACLWPLVNLIYKKITFFYKKKKKKEEDEEEEVTHINDHQ